MTRAMTTVLDLLDSSRTSRFTRPFDGATDGPSADSKGPSTGVAVRRTPAEAVGGGAFAAAVAA